ncbi:MAG: serine hydrolase domain-containing protein, partial [Anaerolineales bacterium]
MKRGTLITRCYLCLLFLLAFLAAIGLSGCGEDIPILIPGEEETATPVAPLPSESPVPPPTRPPTETPAHPTLTPTPHPPVVATATPSKELELALDALVNNYVVAEQFIGTVLVAKGDTILLKKGYGMAEFTHGYPNQPDTIFRLASLTKPFTALAIMMLQEDGLLNVNDPIGMYLPEFPNGGRITIAHLLSHSSGIPSNSPIPDEDLPDNLEGLIEFIKGLPLEFSPGTDRNYSNNGYRVLGYLIETVSGQSYASFLDERVFRPLRMTRSGFYFEALPSKEIATGYWVISPDKVKKAPGTLSELVHAAGALYSTVGDLYLWDRALYTEKMVDQSTLDLMYSEGYGWFTSNAF